MIYTLTFNPAIDYVMKVDNLKNGETNRSKCEQIYFGGKGINVSFVLSELGVQSVALGFIAGFTGEALNDAVTQSGINSDFIRLKSGVTRINVKLKSDNETEINAQGPIITQGDIDSLYKKLEKLNAGDVLVLAGSVPNSLPSDIYEKIIEKLQGKNIKFVVDATCKLLLNVLKFNPYLIKPNKSELEEIARRELNDNESIISEARKLKKSGAKNVLVSLGADGAILVDENDNVHIKSALGGKPVNTVGAGDSMVAGFIAYCDEGYEKALQMSLACGGATATSEGLAKKDDILKLLN